MKKFAIMAAAAAMVATSIAEAATPADTLVIATRIDDVITLDPQESFEFEGANISQNVYDKLVAFDPNNLGPLKPGLAESWTISDDTLTYTFQIRKGVNFHSGNPVTAADAEFSIRRAVLLNKTPSFIITQFGFTPENLEETVKATGEYELTLKVDKPYAPSFVLNCLTATIGGIVDKKTAMAHEKDGDMGNGWLKTNSAGSGAYKVRSWKPNESYILEANPDYWQGKPAMNRVVVRHIAESATQRLLLEKGDIDVARNLSPEDVAAIQGKAGFKVVDDLKGRIMYAALNQKNEILANPKVIEAMKHLVDYQGMVNSFLKGQFVAHQAFLPLTYLGELKEQPYKLDVARAKALLAEAGYPDGFEVEINVRTAQERLEIAQSFQNTLGQAGIKATLVTGTGKQILTTYRARNHGIYIGAWGPDYPDPHTNADTFARNPDNSDEAGNTGYLMWRTAYSNPEMTAMAEAAVLEKDTDKRAEMYRELQRLHQKVAPFIPMSQRIIQDAMPENVKGLVAGGAITNTFYWTVTK